MQLITPIMRIQHKQQLSCSAPLGEEGHQFPRKAHPHPQFALGTTQEGCTIYVIYANWGCGEKPAGGNYIDCEDQTEKNQSCRFAKQY